MVANTEDEYVQLAIKLALDVNALSNLRMGLRDLMSKSPLCDGSKFALGLESAYRNMWRRYCKGDVPSLRRMEILQQQQDTFLVSEESSGIKSSDPPRITTTSSYLGPVKENGFNFGLSSSSLNTSASGEENGVVNSGKSS